MKELKHLKALTKSLLKSKALISILCIALLVADFPAGISQAESSAASKTQTAVNAPTTTPVSRVSEPNSSPTPPTTALDSNPTPPPTTKPDSNPAPAPTPAPEGSTSLEAAGLSSVTSQSLDAGADLYSLEIAAAEQQQPALSLQASYQNHPELIALYNEYIAAFSENGQLLKQPTLTKEQVELLLTQGAEVEDLYAVAFLQDLLSIDPLTILSQKQSSELNWLEWEQQRNTAISPDITLDANSVTSEVYEEFAPSSSRLQSVTSATYALESEPAPDLSSMPLTLAALSATVSSVIEAEGPKMANETFKEQYSDHYGNSETIDPASGSLTWKSTQLSLPGRDGLDLNLGIMYNSSSSGRTFDNYNDLTSSLGSGWIFRFPSIQDNYGESILHDGEGASYEVKYDYNANGVYMGTLKNAAQKDTFVYPTTKNGVTTFRVEHADKRTEYFNAKGRVTQIVDAYGNALTFTYTDLAGRIVLNTIVDTMGRKLTFYYEDITSTNDFGNTLRVVATDANNQQFDEIIYHKDPYSYGRYLESVELQNGETTSFTYMAILSKYDYYHKSFNSNYWSLTSFYALARVNYNGTSDTQYTYEQTIRNLGNAGQIEGFRVSSRYDTLLKSNGTAATVMNKVNYTYTGDYTGYPYTGKPDPLPEEYQYSSTATAVNASGVAQQQTTTTYSGKHQVLSTESKVVSGTQAGERTTTLYSGFLTDFIFTPTVIEERTYSSDSDVNPSHLFMDYTYDANGFLTSETKPLTADQRSNSTQKEKFTTRYQYEPTYYFVSSVSWYPNENSGIVSEHYSYNAQGRLQQLTNAAGESTTYAYTQAPDNSGRLYQVVEEKTVNGNRAAKAVTRYGAETQYAYPTEVEQWFNIGTSSENIVKKNITYDMSSGRVLKETDGNNQAISYEYDAVGRLTKEIRPEVTNTNGEKYSQITEYNYYTNLVSPNLDSVNAGTFGLKVDSIQTITQTSSGQTQKTYANGIYNGLGLLMLQEQWDSSAGQWTFRQYHYDEFGQATYQIDQLGNEIQAGYDSWGRQNRLTDSYGNVYTSDYDVKQRKAVSYMTTADTGEQLNYAEAFYDQWGQVTSKKTYTDWPSQNQAITESYQYDLSGNVTGYTDPMKHLNDAGVTTAYSYDVLNRLVSVQDALNQITRYSYDGNSQLTKVTIQAKGGTEQTLNTKTYNEAGLLTTKQDGSGNTESHAYNNLGQLTSTTDRNGSVFGYSYDESGQLKTSTISGTVNGAAQTQRTELVYGDGSPNQQSITTYVNNSVKATQQTTTDSLNQVRRYSAVAYSSNGSGNHSLYVLNQRDALGRMTQLSDSYLGFYVNYQYNKQRLEKVQTNGSSAVTHAASANVVYSYYGNGQVKSLLYPALSDGSELKSEYTYNKALGWTETVKNLKGSSVLSSFSYSYDDNGNIIAVSESRNSGAAQTTTYGYDALNRLLSITRPDGGSTTYSYDVRGNRLTMSDTAAVMADIADTSYSYDLLNTLTSVTKNGSTTSFQYYADGLRYLKSTGNTHTQVNYDFNGQVISEETLNGSSIVQKSNYVRGDRVLVKKDQTASKDYYYLYNGHGDVVQIVNTSGAIVNNYEYDVWGNITSQTEGISNPFKYTGEIYDEETGLYYLRARYYDPSIGRFLNEDTVEGQIDNPLSQNLYTYVVNNPLIYNDPTGHFIGTITGAILGGIVGGVTAAVQGTNIKAGIAGGAVSGAIGGAAIDMTIATGGTTLVITAAVVAGALGGAAGDIVNQAGNNLAQGKSATSDINVQSVLINAGIGAASGVLGGATAVVMRSFEDATKKIFQGIATNALKSGDDTVLKNSISNVYKAAVKIGNSNATIEYSTTVVYSASSNTVVYLVNNQVVQTVVVNVTQAPTQNAKQSYTKVDGTVIRVQKD